MTFAKPLRERVRSGEITCSVRIWKQPRVKVGGRYGMLDGEIEIDALREISQRDITPALARRGGFGSVDELMKVAQHGRGERVFLVEFHWESLA